MKALPVERRARRAKPWTSLGGDRLRMVFGSMKRTSSRMNLELLDVLERRAREVGDEAPTSSSVGGAGARGDPDDPLARDPGLVDLAGVVDQVRLGPVLARDFDRRCEFEEFCEPMTSTRSQCEAICLTAAWRLVVAVADVVGAGPVMFGKRSRRRTMIALVSSTESVVCRHVGDAVGVGHDQGVDVASVSTSTVCSGASPIVPSTSS